MARDADSSWKTETLAAQAMGWLDPATSAVAPAIHPSTNYARDDAYKKVFGRGYTRDEKQHSEQGDELLAATDGGAKAFLISPHLTAATPGVHALTQRHHGIPPQNK